MNNSTYRYDAIIIGAGIGGLISACNLARGGKKVLLVEKLSFLGGRFSAFHYHGSEISSGAFHTFPHGDSGPLAQALTRLGITLDIPKGDIFASFFFDGKQVITKTAVDVLDIVPKFKDKLVIWRTLLQMWLKVDYNGTFGDWLTKIGASVEVTRIFDRFCQFAISADINSIPYKEGRAITEMIGRFGLPGVPVGGAREVVNQLSKAAASSGVSIWKTTTVEKIIFDAASSRVIGAVVKNRRKDILIEVNAPLIISTIGPQNSIELLSNAGIDTEFIESYKYFPPAIGLKVHVLTAKSLINHKSIMFCLDTKRVAGILQATNTDPSLAPAGKHLLISHQTIRPGADWQEEKRLALEDWRYIFGENFDQCEVIGISHFPERFPVNWATQGMDIRSQPYAEYGFWFVGDGFKPRGLMMVEGVAASAESVANQILGINNLTPWIPSFKEEVVKWGRRIKKWTKMSIGS